jgi:hypothetical protein
VAALVAMAASPAEAGNKKSDFVTAVPAMLEAVEPEVKVTR